MPETQVLVTQSLYWGNTVSGSVRKERVYKMEDALSLETQHQRRLLRLRWDAGLRTDENLNFILWRGYPKERKCIFADAPRNWQNRSSNGFQFLLEPTEPKGKSRLAGFTVL